MAVTAQAYFTCLKSYLNLDYYAIQPNLKNELKLSEKISTVDGKKELNVLLSFRGDAFAIKLDKEVKKGQHLPLFHFLDDTGRPWSKRCDFVVFHLNRTIRIYCIEFKYKTLPVETIMNQLKSSTSWCHSLFATIKNYTNKKRRLYLTKYVLSCHPNPAAFLDPTGKYLQREPSIRHYLYNEVIGMQMEDLENASVEHIG